MIHRSATRSIWVIHGPSWPRLICVRRHRRSVIGDSIAESEMGIGYLRIKSSTRSSEPTIKAISNKLSINYVKEIQHSSTYLIFQQWHDYRHRHPHRTLSDGVKLLSVFLAQPSESYPSRDWRRTRRGLPHIKRNNWKNKNCKQTRLRRDNYGLSAHKSPFRD